ncbi:MAG: hypothetical protein ACFCU5_03660 [Pleurocapsa sp.]
MSWQKFLLSISNNPKYELTLLEKEVIICILETKNQTKNDLFEAYNQLYSPINEEAFTQRLKNIYRKFQIIEKGHKLPQLHKYLVNKYLDYKNQNTFFSEIGLSYIYPQFPHSKFSQEIERVLFSENQDEKEVDILQTFAPNLDNYYEHLIKCLENQVKVRILLAWPYSQAAKLRETVLIKYANVNLKNEINICNAVVANLETLEKIIQVVGQLETLEIKLYDTLPSLAIYRAGSYVLVAPFLHGSLAINTFQLELNLHTANQLITNTLQQDFELMWQVARCFYPNPQTNWRNDLKILFTE